VSIRILVRRAGAGLAATTAMCFAVPAVASAADTLSITPCNSGCTPDNAHLTAGGASSFTLSATLTEPTVTDVASDLTPGLLTNLTASPTCLLTPSVPIGMTTAHSPTCQVGSGTITTTGAIPVTTYETAATSAADAAGYDIVNGGGMTVAHAELSLHGVSSGSGAGQAVGHLDLPIPAGPLQTTLTAVSFNIWGTVNGRPATRMPSICSPPVLSTLLINGTATATASPDVKDDSGFQSTCPTLPYAPVFAVSGKKDTGDAGVEIATTLTQTSSEAANHSLTLAAPGGTLSPDTAALSLSCAGAPAITTGCTSVGTAALSSPLIPFQLSGKVYFNASNINAPTLDIVFPPPFGIALVGQVGLAPNAQGQFPTTFPVIPDVPISSLGVVLNSSPQLFTTSCSPASATFSAILGAQNGASKTDNQTITIQGCPPPVPTASNTSLGGLGTKKPKLKFTLTGADPPPLKSFKVSLPSGLSFNKKKLKKGLKVSGATVFSSKISGGKLVVTLSGTNTTSCTVTIKSPALKVSKSLAKKAKKHKDKTVTVTVTVTDIMGTSTPLSLTFSKPR
jgi:hypothetical protein